MKKKNRNKLLQKKLEESYKPKSITKLKVNNVGFWKPHVVKLYN